MSPGEQLRCEATVSNKDGVHVKCNKPARAFIVSGKLTGVRAVLCNRHLCELEETGKYLAITLLGVVDVERK